MSKRDGRTEAPSVKRRRDARRDGKVVRSQDLVAWVSILISTVVVPGMLSRTTATVRELLARVPAVAEGPDPAAVPALVGHAFTALLGAVMPTLLALMGLAIVGNLAQVGFLLTAKPLKPNMSHLNPLEGMKRIFSVKGLWQGAASLMKLVVIAVVVWVMVAGVGSQFTAAPMRNTADSVRDLASLTLQLVRTVAFVAVIISLGDYFVKRRGQHKDLKMTKQEVRQEHKDSEGDPHTRGRLRSQRLAISRNRMLQSVHDADVVITNPTHLAVAIRYRAGEGAPRVVARGADALAARIRMLADVADVPRVESKPLAQVLYRVCRAGEEIPPELFAGVATVLAFLVRLGDSHRAHRGRLGLSVPDTWTPSSGEPLGRVPPRRRSRLAAGPPGSRAVVRSAAPQR